MSALFEKMRPTGNYDAVLALREFDGKKFYERNKNTFIPVQCPACGEAGEELFYKYGFRHERCSRCRTLFVSPRPDEKSLASYYNEYDSPKAWTRLLVASDADRKALQYEPRVKQLIAYLSSFTSLKNSVAVDVGAGSGAFALALKKTRFFSKVLALDFSEDCVNTCLERGLQAIQGSLEVLSSESAGFIATNDLLEHLSNPSAFLAECRRVLLPGGVLSIATPNGEGFDFQIMREKTRNLVPPEHLTYFNPKSIHLFLSRNGFQDIEVSTPGKLDIDIIRHEKEKVSFELDRFLNSIAEADEPTRRSFQDFLSLNGLSSHMLVTARKGAGK